MLEGLDRKGGKGWRNRGCLFVRISFSVRCFGLQGLRQGMSPPKGSFVHSLLSAAEDEPQKLERVEGWGPTVEQGKQLNKEPIHPLLTSQVTKTHLDYDLDIGKA